MEFVGHLAIGS